MDKIYTCTNLIKIIIKVICKTLNNEYIYIIYQYIIMIQIYNNIIIY